MYKPFAKLLISNVFVPPALFTFGGATVQQLLPRDYDLLMMAFALWISEKVEDNSLHLIITDECIFHSNDITPAQFTKMWSKANPHRILQKNNQYRNSAMVWSGIYIYLKSSGFAILWWNCQWTKIFTLCANIVNWHIRQYGIMRKEKCVVRQKTA